MEHVRRKSFVKDLCSASRAFHISCSSNYNIYVASFGINKGRRFSSQNYSKKNYTDNSHAYSHTRCIPEITSDENHPIFKSSSLQHWYKNWQEHRKHKLTASTFSGAIGLWPQRRVQLWLEKIGQLEPFTGNSATCWSNIMEEKALKRYKEITRSTVLFPGFQVYRKTNPEDDWLAASPDGIVDQLVYELPGNGVLEIKCPFFNGDMKKAYPWTRIPLHYIPQAQGLLEILDQDQMDFFVWTVRGSSLFRVYRDEAYWDLMKIALSDFWWNHVQPAREVCLKSVIKEPLYELRSFRPSPRHDLADQIVYESKRLVDESKMLMREADGKQWINESLL